MLQMCSLQALPPLPAGRSAQLTFPLHAGRAARLWELTLSPRISNSVRYKLRYPNEIHTGWFRSKEFSRNALKLLLSDAGSFALERQSWLQGKRAVNLLLILLVRCYLEPFWVS